MLYSPCPTTIIASRAVRNSATLGRRGAARFLASASVTRSPLFLDFLMDRQHRKLSLPPLLRRDNQGTEDHIVPKLDRKQGVDDQMPLRARESPLGQHQAINVRLGVVVASSFGAEHNDRNDRKALPQDTDRLGDGRSISWVQANLVQGPHSAHAIVPRTWRTSGTARR